LQWVLGISAVVVAVAALLFVLVVAGAWGLWSGGRSSGTWPFGGMMGGSGYGGMMGGSGHGGMMGGSGYGGMMGGSGYGGMMPWAGPSTEYTGDRLSLEQAVSVAEEFAASFSADLEVAEVMEFEENFYAILTEAETGRGAMEILIDPYRGSVGPEPGPNMMWNEKYGHMAWGTSEDSLSAAEAGERAQAWLEAAIPGSRVHENGTWFYGYYTFDFDGSDGQIAGMLSIDADTGAAWLHTWHGRFLSEWEADEGAS
jgi:hypothetical protein